MAFGHPISQFQAIQFMLADISTELDAARLLIRKAASKHNTGARFSMDTAIPKLFASEMSTRVTHKAIQIHGGNGYSREYPVERNYRDARITEIYEGTSEIQRLVISSWVLEAAIPSPCSSRWMASKHWPSSFGLHEIARTCVRRILGFRSHNGADCTIVGAASLACRFATPSFAKQIGAMLWHSRNAAHSPISSSQPKSTKTRACYRYSDPCELICRSIGIELGATGAHAQVMPERRSPRLNHGPIRSLDFLVDYQSLPM